MFSNIISSAFINLRLQFDKKCNFFLCNCLQYSRIKTIKLYSSWQCIAMSEKMFFNRANNPSEHEKQIRKNHSLIAIVVGTKTSIHRGPPTTGGGGEVCLLVCLHACECVSSNSGSTLCLSAWSIVFNTSVTHLAMTVTDGTTCSCWMSRPLRSLLGILLSCWIFRVKSSGSCAAAAGEESAPSWYCHRTPFIRTHHPIHTNALPRCPIVKSIVGETIT